MADVPENEGSTPLRIAYAAGTAAALMLLFIGAAADAQNAKIVGLGATACSQFNREIRDHPALQRDYLAWAQGYMSGLLQRAPAGVDQGLDLLPPTFPLLKQLELLRSYCARNPSSDFSDSAVELYRRLRAEGST
jgi:hypothetical protein